MMLTECDNTNGYVLFSLLSVFLILLLSCSLYSPIYNMLDITIKHPQLFLNYEEMVVISCKLYLKALCY